MNTRYLRMGASPRPLLMYWMLAPTVGTAEAIAALGTSWLSMMMKES